MGIKEEIDMESKKTENAKVFEIKLTEMETGSGAIPVTWCLSPQWLEDHRIKDFYVLFSTYTPTPNGEMAEWRGYAKLSDMMTYVAFLRPGVNRISARITCNEEVVKNWMKRECGKWRDNVINFPKYNYELEKDKNGEWTYKIDCCDSNWQDHLQVEIPGECFAPEPWEIEKVWVNWLWKYKSVDQCEFRKRRMFAYSIQPIIFLFLMVVRIVFMLACLSVGLKGLKWGPIFSPLNYNTGDIAFDVEGSHFEVKKWKLPFSFVFVPAIPMALISAISLLVCGGGSVLKWMLHIAIAALFIPALVFLIVSCNYIIENVKFGKRFGAAQEIIRAEQQRRYQEMMTCSNTKVIRKLSDLPKAQRTIRLRFLGVKSMVCRPFAR